MQLCFLLEISSKFYEQSANITVQNFNYTHSCSDDEHRF